MLDGCPLITQERAINLTIGVQKFIECLIKLYRITLFEKLNGL